MGLGGIPVLALFGGSYFLNRKIKKSIQGNNISKKIIEEWQLRNFEDEDALIFDDSEPLNIGIIGFGWQGEQLAKALGYAHPDWIDQNTVKGKPNDFLTDFLVQFDLNVRISGICDLFEPRVQRGVKVSEAISDNGKSVFPPAKIYDHYTDLIHDPDIHAVIIATPDFWHATMVKEAIRAGKHIYCEKPMTIDVKDAREIHELIKESDLVFQLGHQNFQQVSHLMAWELIHKNVLGPINLIEFTANRFRVGSFTPEFPHGANTETVNWDAFQEILPVKRPFDLHRFFNWYHFFDYGIGIAGSMLSHEYSAANQMLEMGIPRSVTSSGGKYVVRFESEIPDVYQSIMEYPEKKYSFLYSITYGNSVPRGRWIMGEDGTMRVGSDVVVYPEKDSEKYKDLDPLKPLYSYEPGIHIDAVTSASQAYFAQKGLVNTHRYGKRMDTLHLHVKEWIDCIRGGGIPSCNVNQGFEEVVACCMSHEAYMRGSTVYWDAEHMRIG